MGQPIGQPKGRPSRSYRDDRPQIVGEALQQISEDKQVAEAMFEILETQKVIGSGARLTVLPRGGELLAQLLAGHSEPGAKSPPPLG